jgi:hypothetical protein
MKLDQENTSPNENAQSKRIPVNQLRIDTSFEDKEESKADRNPPAPPKTSTSVPRVLGVRENVDKSIKTKEAIMKNSLNQIPKAYTRSGSDSRALSQKNVNPNHKKASEKSDMSDTMSSKSITQNFLSGVVNTLSKVVNRSQV